MQSSATRSRRIGTLASVAKGLRSETFGSDNWSGKAKEPWTSHLNVIVLWDILDQ